MGVRKNKQLKKDVLSYLEAGMTPLDVAYALQISVGTVYKYQRGDLGGEQGALACRQSTADYFEYFSGDKALETGNLCNGKPILTECDPVLEALIAEEELLARLEAEDGQENT